MEWQRRQRGIPSVEFKQHLHRLRQSRSAATATAGTLGTATPQLELHSQAQRRRVLCGCQLVLPALITKQNSYSGLERDSGRARTILPDPTDANTVYLLTSGGGLWVTHNFTVSQSTWTALTDSLVTTAGGSVAFGPHAQRPVPWLR